ncbi:MAG: hypothetical protein JST40_09420 [Armatimonadetes bacterium]|nr:hypothetical protein [Armatimonadota bacterium]
MNRLGIGFLGACFGSLLVVLLHPLTRGLANPLVDQQIKADLNSHPMVLRNTRVVPEPKDATGAAFWLLVASREAVLGRSGNHRDLAETLEVARGWSEHDKDNAFWLQMESAVLWDRGLHDQSIQAWISAAKAARWEDYQMDRLQVIRKAISRTFTNVPSWVDLYLTTERSSFAGQYLMRHATRLLTRAPLTTASGLKLRYAIARAGHLIRGGSSSIELAQIGSSIAELAGRDRTMAAESTPRRLLFARIQLADHLRKAKMENEADDVVSIYRATTGWSYFLDQDALREEREQLGIGALAATGIVPLSTYGILWGTVLIVLGWFAQKIPVQWWQSWWIGIGTASIGLALLVATGLWIHSMVMFLCGVMMCFRSRAVRRADPANVGIGFQSICTIIALYSLVILGLMWIYGSSIRQYLIPGVFPEWNPSFTLATLWGSLLMILVVTLTLGPTFALLTRYRVDRLASQALMSSGRVLCMLGIVIGGIAGPLAMATDQFQERDAGALLRSEPLYFFNR